MGLDRMRAKTIIAENHYTKSVPSGDSFFFSCGGAIVCFSIPANKNISSFLLGSGFGDVWELSRLWAPDGHRKNLLTAALSIAVKSFRIIRPQVPAIVSYADPNAGHHGGVYRAASWIDCGQSEETRAYQSPDGVIVARRAFHSGSYALKKKEIEAQGYCEIKSPGKLRFAKPLSKKARREILKRFGKRANSSKRQERR